MNYNSLIQENERIKLKMTELEEELEKHDIFQCSSCKNYNKNIGKCDMCDTLSCSCTEITHVKTWNLSGMYMCHKCILLYCHHCIRPIDNDGKKYCNECEERFK